MNALMAALLALAAWQQPRAVARPHAHQAARAGKRAPVATKRDTAHAVAAVVRAPLDSAQVVNFRTLIEPETVYVGQQARYELGVFVDESVRDRLRRMEALPPELRGLMAYEPPAALTGFPLRSAGRHVYTAHVSLRAIFPLAPGRYAVAPARLVYAMPLSYSFFSREESFELRSDSAVIIAVEPPVAGRPPDFIGAVGNLQVEARVDTVARVGDPLHLIVRVSGAGNVKLFPRPAVTSAWATAIATGERVTIAPDSIVVRGAKEFDWVLTPTLPGRQTLGAIRYPFFDPDKRRYDVALTIPMVVSVATGTLAIVDTAAVAAGPAWMIRPVLRGQIPLPLYRRPLFVLALLVMPLPAIAFAVANRPRRVRRRRTPAPAQLLRQIAHRGERGDVRLLRRAFLNAVAARLREDASALAEPESLRHAARRAGTSGTTAAAAAAFVAELNVAAFAPERTRVAGASDRALKLFRAIDQESRRWRTPAAAGTLLVAAALSLAGTLGATEPTADEAQFSAAVTAFGDHRYAEAARAFATIAEREPRAADAWANLGTAAFAAGDSAHAALGWQRALRLEPLAADVRERLDLLAPASAAAPGAVPPVPPLPLILMASLLWTTSWLALAVRLRRRERVLAGSLALTALGAALVLGAAGGFVDTRLSPRGLAVARRDLPLRLLPALGAERVSVLHTAETVRVIRRDPPWAQVRVDRDREGWVQDDALLPLVAD